MIKARDQTKCKVQTKSVKYIYFLRPERHQSNCSLYRNLQVFFSPLF